MKKSVKNVPTAKKIVQLRAGAKAAITREYRRKISGVTNPRSLAAFKAWHTMNTAAVADMFN